MDETRLIAITRTQMEEVMEIAHQYEGQACYAASGDYDLQDMEEYFQRKAAPFRAIVQAWYTADDNIRLATHA